MNSFVKSYLGFMVWIVCCCLFGYAFCMPMHKFWSVWLMGWALVVGLIGLGVGFYYAWFADKELNQ